MARINLDQVQLAEFESQLTELEVTEINDTELQSISGGGCLGIGYQVNSNTGCFGISWS